MTAHITPPNFDPHAEAIDGPTPDPWPVDKRLRDDRVRATRKPVWEDQWDGDRLRPGWVERLAPTDPAPEYFARETAEGLTDAPAQATAPHGLSALFVGVIATATLLTVVGVLVLVALGFAWVAGYRL